MEINFAIVDEEFIANTVQEGYYISEEELVRDAVRRLRESMKKTRRPKPKIEDKPQPPRHNLKLYEND